MTKLLLIIIVVINLITILYYRRKKIRRMFNKQNIKIVGVENIDEMFKPNIKNNLKIPQEETFIKTFSIPVSYGVGGMTTDYESWILASLSKKAKNIFEFGTCSGKTTFLFGMNSVPEANIFTITLDPNDVGELKNQPNDNKTAARNIKNESIYNQFMFSGHEVEKKIKVIFQDSRNLDIKNFENQFDLIFIDGGHTYSCIKSDTEKALQMIRKNGIILWHDYANSKRSSKDVYKYLEEISKKISIESVEYTSFCFYRKK